MDTGVREWRFITHAPAHNDTPPRSVQRHTLLRHTLPHDSRAIFPDPRRTYRGRSLVADVLVRDGVVDARAANDIASARTVVGGGVASGGLARGGGRLGGRGLDRCAGHIGLAAVGLRYGGWDTCQ